jgi:hypothetical protein
MPADRRSPEEVIRSVLASGRREVQLHGLGLEREIVAALRAVGQLAEPLPVPPPDDGRFEALGKHAEATCLAHHRLVRWMASPTWWYHTRPGRDGGESCMALWDTPAPLVFIHDGKPSIRTPGYDQQATMRYVQRTAGRRAAP